MIYSPDGVFWYGTNTYYPSNGTGMTLYSSATQMLMIQSPGILDETFPYQFSFEYGTPDQTQF